jgi:hypothetical protein
MCDCLTYFLLRTIRCGAGGPEYGPTRLDLPFPAVIRIRRHRGLAPIGISHLLLRISSGVSMDRRLAPVRTSHDARRNPRPPRLPSECHMMRGKDRGRHASGHAYLRYEGLFRRFANIYLAYEGLPEPPKQRNRTYDKARNRGIPTIDNQGNMRQEPLVTQIDVCKTPKPPLVSEIADPNNPS